MSWLKYATMKSLRTFKRSSNAHVKNLPLSATDAISSPYDSSFKTKQFTINNAETDPQKIIETVSKHRAWWEEDPSERKRSFFFFFLQVDARGLDERDSVTEDLADLAIVGVLIESTPRIPFISVVQAFIYSIYLRKYFILRSILRSTFPGAKGQLLSVKGNTSV